MTMRILAAALVLQVAIAGAASAQTAGTTQPLAGKAAVDALVGNTMIATMPNDPGVEMAFHILADGTIELSRRENGTWKPPVSSRWTVRDDGRFCVTPDGGPPGEKDCVAISVSGDTATFTPPDDAALSGRIVQGDAVATAQAGPQDAVTGKAAIDLLVGNTLTFTRDGLPEEETAIYFRADGSGRAKRNMNDPTDKATPIGWSVRSDGMFCVADAGKKPGDGDCTAISVAGGTVTLTAPGRPPLSGKILKGNARSL